jgi:hypothetical protein
MVMFFATAAACQFDDLIIGAAAVAVGRELAGMSMAAHLRNYQ